MSQGKLLRRAAVELDFNRHQRMLRKYIQAFLYKLQTLHKLEEEDNDRRVEMGETLLNHYQNDPSILDNIWFSNEAVFHLSAKVNRHKLEYGKQKILKLFWRKGVNHLSLLGGVRSPLKAS